MDQRGKIKSENCIYKLRLKLNFTLIKEKEQKLKLIQTSLIDSLTVTRSLIELSGLQTRKAGCPSQIGQEKRNRSTSRSCLRGETKKFVGNERKYH